MFGTLYLFICGKPFLKKEVLSNTVDEKGYKNARLTAKTRWRKVKTLCSKNENLFDIINQCYGHHNFQIKWVT